MNKPTPGSDRNCPKCNTPREEDYYHNVDPAIHAPRDETPIWICRRCKDWWWMDVEKG